MPQPSPWGSLSARNHLLATLPPRERRRTLPSLEQVQLERKAVLHQPGEPITHLYFPLGCVVSLLTPLAGAPIEVALVGREGMVGLPVFLGAEMPPVISLVSVPGEALRVTAEDFRRHVTRGCLLSRMLLRYSNALLTQLAHTAACGLRHPLPRRLCCWLLMVHDRARVERFPWTHELLAAMLGVRRASLTEAAAQLRQAGWIRYGRGQLTILDRAGLETAACSCYPTLQATWNSLYER